MSWVAALVLAATSTSAQPDHANVITRQQAEQSSTGELARRFLPAHVASRVVRSALVDRSLIQNQRSDGEHALSAIQFETVVQPLGNQLCRTEMYHVSLFPLGGRDNLGSPDAAVKSISVNRHVRIAVAPRCELPPQAKFAHVQPSTMEEEAGALLLWLYDARSRSRQVGELPFHVSCRSELEENPCGNDARTILASLPLEATHIIEAPSKLRPEGWRVAVMPSGPGPGHRYWEVLIGDSIDGRRATLIWTFPAPF